MKGLISILLLMFIAISSTVAAPVSFVFEEPKNAVEEDVFYDISEHAIAKHIAALIEQKFAFKEPIEIVFGGNDGPLYDPELHTVFIPYSFIVDSHHYFAENDYEKDFGVSAKQAAIDTLLHTIFHEVAHAYIEDQGIPILGKEEDAADNLATLMLLEHFEGGDSAAISAADMFAFESNDSPEYYEVIDYIGEHSFDLQRHFSTLCLVYGFDPETHKDLLNEVNGEDRTDRQDYCIEYFETVRRNWQVYLN